MIIRRADENTEAGVMPGEELLDAMVRYHDEMAQAGILRAGEGLHPSAKGARVKFRDGEPVVTDGPFAEAKELIAGFSMIEVGSRDEAIAWVKKWPRLDGDVELEIRQVFEADDFGDEFTPELRKMEERQREQAAVNAAR
jgi:hypothetical protein